MNKEYQEGLEKLCTKYIPNRNLGDFLPAYLTMRVVRNYVKSLSRLDDKEAYGYLRDFGVSKERAEDFLEERNKLRKVKNE